MSNRAGAAVPTEFALAAGAKCEGESGPVLRFGAQIENALFPDLPELLVLSVLYEGGRLLQEATLEHDLPGFRL